MTWKRVATAAVLTPFAVGLALWSSTAVLALALALVVMIALFEYFSLGDAIGHRAGDVSVPKAVIGSKADVAQLIGIYARHDG